MFYTPFVALTSLVESSSQPSALCVFGPWLAVAATYAIAAPPRADTTLELLRVSVHVVALSAFYPHPDSSLCSLCALLLCAQSLATDTRTAVALTALMLLGTPLYTMHCPCVADADKQISSMLWAETMQLLYWIIRRVICPWG